MASNPYERMTVSEMNFVNAVRTAKAQSPELSAIIDNAFKTGDFDSIGIQIPGRNRKEKRAMLGRLRRALWRHQA